MQSQQLPTESQIFEDEVLPGTEGADHPPEEMSERHDHTQNLVGKSQNLAFRQVIHFAGVRRFGEVQGHFVNKCLCYVLTQPPFELAS